MASMQKKNLSSADEKRSFPKGPVEVVKLGDMTFGRATLQPGWKWSESVKPIVKLMPFAEVRRRWFDLSKEGVNVEEIVRRLADEFRVTPSAMRVRVGQMKLVRV